MMAKNYQNPSKAVAKAMKTSAKQMEKGWGLHFSAVLNLQLISRFPGQGKRGENEAKRITQNPRTITEKTMKHVQTNGKKHVKHMEKGWKLHFSALLSSAQSGTNFKVS